MTVYIIEVRTLDINQADLKKLIDAASSANLEITAIRGA